MGFPLRSLTIPTMMTSKFHPIFSSTFVCLLVDDRPKSPLPPTIACDFVGSLSLPITNILSLSNLCCEDRPFEDHCTLADSHVLLRSERVLDDHNVGEVYIPLKDLFDGGDISGHFISYQVRNPSSSKPKGILNLSYKLIEAPAAPPISLSIFLAISTARHPAAAVYSPPSRCLPTTPRKPLGWHGKEAKQRWVRRRKEK